MPRKVYWQKKKEKKKAQTDKIQQMSLVPIIRKNETDQKCLRKARRNCHCLLVMKRQESQNASKKVTKTTYLQKNVAKTRNVEKIGTLGERERVMSKANNPTREPQLGSPEILSLMMMNDRCAAGGEPPSTPPGN